MAVESRGAVAAWCGGGGEKEEEVEPFAPLLCPHTARAARRWFSCAHPVLAARHERRLMWRPQRVGNGFDRLDCHFLGPNVGEARPVLLEMWKSVSPALGPRT